MNVPFICHRQLLWCSVIALAAAAVLVAQPAHAVKRVAVLEFRGDAQVKPEVLALRTHESSSMS